MMVTIGKRDWQGPAIAAGLFLVALCLYYPSLDHPLVFDDRPFFRGDYVANCAAAFHPLVQRFLSCASFAHQYMLQGEDYPAFRWGNILLHGFAASMLFLFLRDLLRETLPDLKRQAVPASAMVALLFVLHPVHVYAVAYLVERSIVMATVGVLAFWWAGLKALTTGKRAWSFWAVLAYYLAIFSKEHAVLALAGWPLVAVMLRRRYRVWRWDTVAAFFICLVIGGYLIEMGRGSLAHLYEPMGELALQGDGGPYLHLRSALTQCGLFFEYLSLWLWPDGARMSIDMRENLVQAMDALTLFKGGLFFAWGAAGAWLAVKGGKKGVIGFGLLMPWTMFWIELATIRVQEIFVLYRGYLWFAALGATVACGLALGLADRRGRWLLSAAWLLAVVLCVPQARDRMATFSSSYALWNDAVRLSERASSPGIFTERAYNNRGYASMEEGHFVPALQDFDRALVLNPRMCIVQRNRGVALVRLGRANEAMASLNRAIELCPKDPDNYFSRHAVWLALGRKAEAREDIRRACALGSGWACTVDERWDMSGKPGAGYRISGLDFGSGRGE